MNNSLFPTVILAGGIASRLRPLSHTLPKSLIEINGEPFIAHQLRLLHRQGIRQVVLCIGYLGDRIIDVVGDGQQFGLDVTYSSDAPKLLGTAGAIKKASATLADIFFVLYGDSYLPCDFSLVQNTFIHSQKQALMTVFFNQGQWDTSNVEFHNGTILTYDKKNRTSRMHYIDYGLGIFTKKVFDTIPNDISYDLAVLYQTILRNHQLAAHEVTERFYEIGSFSGIQELNDFLRKNKE